MSKPKPTPPPSPTPRKKCFDCTPAPKVFSLCDLCSCWWNCMIFSEGALDPYPYIANLPDLFQKAGKKSDGITTQPSPTSSLSTALVPVCDKNWQFSEEKIDSKLTVSPTVEVILDEHERKRIMTMKEEQHRMKMEILKIEKMAAQLRLKNSGE